jgi:hypothetical protein
MEQRKSRNGELSADELEELRRQHEDLDAAIARLERQASHSVADEAEIRRLKKLKLQKKDKMQALMRRASA